MRLAPVFFCMRLCAVLCYYLNCFNIASMNKNTKTAQSRFLALLRGFCWSYWPDSNRRPADYESAFLCKNMVFYRFIRCFRLFYE